MWNRSTDSDFAEPDLDQFDRMVREAYTEIPDYFRRKTEDILIRVEEAAEKEILQQMGIASPDQLLGLYSGISMRRKSVHQNAPPVDMIYIYRRAILLQARQLGVPVMDVIRNTLIHEIGHHFGLSDADMHRIEFGD